jgi:putative membrane protein
MSRPIDTARSLTEPSRRGRIEIREHPQSRDHLAFIRTVLALERTALAYVRTALAFAAVAVAVAHFMPGAWLALWALGALAGVMFAAAAYRAVRVGRSLRDAKTQAGVTSRTYR